MLPSETATASQIAERAGIPGRERGREAALALARLEVDGLAIKEEVDRRVPRWRARSAAPAAPRFGIDPEA